MAISIQKEPQEIYPAYNDSYLIFNSSLNDQTFAEIKSGTNIFKVFSIDGNYNFNLKDLVISKYPSSFKDKLGSTSNWGLNDNSVLTSLEIEITVYSSSTNEKITRSYEFFRGVKQIGEKLFSNNCQILNQSQNGVDYYLHWFEGYPLDFTLQKVNVGRNIKIKNKNNSIISEPLTSTLSTSFRVLVDKGTSNWTIDNFLGMFDIENRLEILENDLFKTNLTLKKHQSRCGVYLKWFNRFGGYSYWLFEEYFDSEVRGSSSNLIQTSELLNIGDSNFTENFKDIGKEAESSLELRAMTDENSYNHLSDLFTSPYVTMYSAKEPFQEGTWLTVKVNTRGFKYNNKKQGEKIKVDISLPQQYNLSL